MNPKKKAQNEIVGFVIIVVIVIIIGLFFLGFYLRKEPVRTESKNVENFLKASMKYTTSCKIDTQPLSLMELIKRCQLNQPCGQEYSCEILNKTLLNLLEKTWRINSDNQFNYYKLNIYYRETQETQEAINQEILTIEEGKCTGSRTGAEEFFRHGSGDIFATLEICSE